MTKDPQRTEFRETQYGWECRRGADQARLSQDRMAEARHRGRAASGRRHHFAVADSAPALRETHPGIVGEMGQRSARSHLARAARRQRPAMAPGFLWRGQKHRRWTDAGP